MRAAVLDNDGKFSVETRPEPVPGRGEVAVRVAYAGVQYGDVLARDGHFPMPKPFVPGFEVAGEIVAVGEGVDAGRIGEHVTALIGGGGYAEVALAPADLALSATGVDPRTAAAFGWVTPTAYDLVNTVGRVRADDSVLVHAAAGGVGSLIAQFLTAVDARRVVGVVGNAEQVDYAQQLGYHRVLAADAFPDDLGDETFDVIFDPIGGAARTANLARLAPHGRLVVYGNIASFEAIAISINDLLANGQSLVTYNSNLASQTNPQRLAASAAQALALVADGSVRIGITAEYPLADVGQAVANLATGSTLGKSIIRVR